MHDINGVSHEYDSPSQRQMTLLLHADDNGQTLKSAPIHIPNAEDIPHTETPYTENQVIEHSAQSHGLMAEQEELSSHQEDRAQSLIQIPRIDHRLPMGNHVMIGSLVWLRPIFPRDKDEARYRALYADPVRMKWFGYGNTITGNAFNSAVITKAKQTSAVHCLLTDITPERRCHLSFFTHLGFSGVISIVPAPTPSYLNHYEVFYCGNGGTSHALATLLSHPRAPRQWFASVHPDNTASVKILINNGFVCQKRGVPKYGSIRDVYILKQQSHDL